MKKLSIIIPVYNSEHCISRCIDSLKSQNPHSLNECEFIFVDDASTDNSAGIIKEQMPYAKIIIHRENKRQGGARNTGIKAASGEYIWFVDSDDKIAEGALDILLRKLSGGGIDILYFGIESITEANVVKSRYLPIQFSGEASGIDFLKTHKMPVNPIFVYRREFLLSNNIFFEEGTFFEDNLFALKAALCAKKILTLGDYIYIRFLTQNSSSRTVSLRQLQSLATVLSLILKLADKNNRREHCLIYFSAMRVFNCLMAIYKKIRRLPPNFLEKNGIKKSDILKIAWKSRYPKYMLETIYLAILWNYIFTEK